MREIGKLIVEDHNERLTNGMDVNGAQFAALQQITIDRKSAKGSAQPSTPLFDTGQMKKLILKSPKRNKVEVRVRSNRDQIGSWHQSGEARGGKVREWFGISDMVVAQIGGIVMQEIERKINISVNTRARTL